MTGAPAAAAVTWVMWEARAAAGHTPELLAWVLQIAHERAQIYASDDRVVAICPANSSPMLSALAQPPPELLARPAHQWQFERVR